MGFVAVFGLAESTGVQTRLLNFSDQTKNTAHNVADGHFTRLSSDQALANLAHTLDQRSSISGLCSSDDTKQQLSSCDSTRSRIPDLASLQKTFILSDGNYSSRIEDARNIRDELFNRSFDIGVFERFQKRGQSRGSGHGG
jgi:hypothetical protein